MKIIHSVILSLAVLTAGCSDTAVTPVSIKSASTLATAKIAAVGNLVADNDRRTSTAMERELNALDLSRATGIAAVWTTDPGPSSLSNAGTNSLQLWMERMFDPDFVNSNDSKVTFAGRIATTLDIFCYLGEMGFTNDATGLPADGTTTVTLPESIVTNCGASADSAGTSTTVTVTTLSDTTIYDKSFVVNMGNDCPFKFLARANSASINIASAEDQSCDSRDQASGSIFRYDAATQQTRFSYISQSFSGTQTGHEFYRGFLDEAADQAHILGHYGPASGGSISGQGGISFTAAGKPTAGGTVALSVRAGGAGFTDGDYNGCINISDSEVATDNSLACTVTGTDISDAVAVITGEHGSNTAIASIYTVSATTDVSFTNSTNIYTFTAR